MSQAEEIGNAGNHFDSLQNIVAAETQVLGQNNNI